MKEKIRMIKEKYYIGYKERIIINVAAIIILSVLSAILLNSILKIEKNQQIKYTELGNLEYKVGLKENEFYETEYLNENMEYISSLIKNIDIDVYYELKTQEEKEIKYEIIYKLLIYNENGNNTLYEKEYPIKENVISREKIEEKIQVDYEYYNNLASNFKSTYGVEAESKLDVYVKIKKEISNVDAGKNEMILSIPLTKKTINIKLDNKSISSEGTVEKANVITLFNIMSVALLVIFSILLLISIIKTIKLLMLLKPNKTKYDKCLKRILTEYDRLIIETHSKPELEEKKIIKVKEFEELLDVRDNLKKPIIYYSIVKHHKAYFFVEHYTNCYLYILKSSDIEESNEKI